MIVASGSKVSLRRAQMHEREKVWQWFERMARATLGSTQLTDRIPLTELAFNDFFGAHRFEAGQSFNGRGFILVAGNEDVGFITHGPVNLSADVVQLDLWLAGVEKQGRGYGSDAIDLLCGWLQSTHGVNRFVMRPSRRNVHALRAMRRSGFRETDLDPDSVLLKLGLPQGISGDEILLFRILPLPPASLQRNEGQSYLFIDSEFTHLHQPRLISFAAVSDLNAAFYCELRDWKAEQCSDFVRQRVLPQLENEMVSRTDAATAFVAWLKNRTGNGQKIVLVSDSGFDRWAVQELLASETLPDGVEWKRVTVAYEEINDACMRLGLRRHHALDDARALQQLLKPSAIR